LQYRTYRCNEYIPELFPAIQSFFINKDARETAFVIEEQAIVAVNGDGGERFNRRY
jgi:hypothetical protein